MDHPHHNLMRQQSGRQYAEDIIPYATAVAAIVEGGKMGHGQNLTNEATE